MPVLLTGDYGRDEFAGPVAEIRRAADVFEIPCLRSAADWLKRGETSTELIVIAQARPGEFSAAEIDALHRYAPITPIVALLGTWCEGEMRSGSPWPGVTRIYWHQWADRFREEMASLDCGESGIWAQPLTATAEERLLSSANSFHAELCGVVAVMSDDREMGDWLAAACRQRGMSAIVLRRPPASQLAGVDVVLWDAGLATPEAVDDLRADILCFPGAVLLVLTNFPRLEDVDWFIRAGAEVVLSKPLAVADLFWSIRQRFPPRGGSE